MHGRFGSCDMPVYAMCMRHACSFARYVHVEVICMLKQHATCMLHECLDDMHVTVMLTYTYVTEFAKRGLIRVT